MKAATIVWFLILALGVYCWLNLDKGTAYLVELSHFIKEPDSAWVEVGAYPVQPYESFIKKEETK